MKLSLPPPSETQRRFFAEEHRFVAFGGARGGGKSWAVRVKAVLLCEKYPGIKVMIVRRTYGELRANHIAPLCALLRCGAGKDERLALYSEMKKEITFPNGSMILFRYCAHERDADEESDEMPRTGAARPNNTPTKTQTIPKQEIPDV